MVVSWTWRRNRRHDGDHAGALDGDRSAMMKKPYHITHVNYIGCFCVKSYLCAGMVDTSTVAK